MCYLCHESERNLVIEGEVESEKINIRDGYTKHRIWNSLLGSDKPLQTLEIMEQTECTYEQVKQWLDLWIELGSVERSPLDYSPTGGTRYEYSLTNLDTKKPPMIDLNGDTVSYQVREVVWGLIGTMKEQEELFTAKDILDLVEDITKRKQNRDYVFQYIRKLCLAYYLIVVSKENPRMPKYMVQYYTGPLAPSVRRGKMLYDPNLRMMVTQ